ncbi:hypothetical protein BJI67_11785 [Acidihalobacter aeolianus]|uniref:Uncharacterized protein n=1 Tax=Acidihalobacter aeolianus TaxID=2792603 RepID=A0A1D8K9J1_9GAMM|nr:hypothetical protein BJI67_11785 [Acidihalobacter aeolianus]
MSLAISDRLSANDTAVLKPNRLSTCRRFSIFLREAYSGELAVRISPALSIGALAMNFATSLNPATLSSLSSRTCTAVARLGSWPARSIACSSLATSAISDIAVLRERYRFFYSRFES